MPTHAPASTDVDHHPKWCTQVLCIPEVAGIEHRATPICLAIGPYDVQIGRAHYIETTADGPLSHGDRVTITAIDRECVDDAGGEIRVDIPASESDARVLAASITCIADQLGATR